MPNNDKKSKPKYLTFLRFVSLLDKDYGSINCFAQANSDYIITLYNVVNSYAKKTKTSTITTFNELMFGKVDSKKVLVVSITLDKKSLKKDFNDFREILIKHDCKIIDYNEKIKRISFEISKKEYLHVNLR